MVNLNETVLSAKKKSQLGRKKLYIYCGVALRGRSIERPLLINGYAYLAVSFPEQRE
jgi:hypothetical protein